MQPWDPWGLGSRPCLLILVPAIPWYFSFSKREGDFHKQIPSQWALFWPSSSVGPLLVFGCLFQSVFLDLHLHRYLLSPPSHSGIYHLEVWEEIFHIHVLPALRHIHSSVSIWSLTTEEHRPLPRWLQGPMPGSWVSLQLLQQPRVYTHKNNLSGQVCLLLQLKKLNLQLCCKRVWKNLSRPFCSPPPEIPPHVNSWLSDSRLAFRLEWDSLPVEKITKPKHKKLETCKEEEDKGISVRVSQPVWLDPSTPDKAAPLPEAERLARGFRALRTTALFCLPHSMKKPTEQQQNCLWLWEHTGFCFLRLTPCLLEDIYGKCQNKAEDFCWLVAEINRPVCILTGVPLTTHVCEGWRISWQTIDIPFSISQMVTGWSLSTF